MTRDPRDVLAAVQPVGSYPQCRRLDGCMPDPDTDRCIYCDKPIAPRIGTYPRG